MLVQSLAVSYAILTLYDMSPSLPDRTSILKLFYDHSSYCAADLRGFSPVKGMRKKEVLSQCMR